MTGNGSTIVYMGLAGPNDIVKLPMLSSLAMDKTIRFSWLYPNQWPNTIRLLREGIVDTSKIITHSIAARRDRRGYPPGRRARRRRHQDHRQALGDAMAKPKFSVSEITTFHQTFEEDLASYAAAGVEGIGIWQFKLPEDGERLPRRWRS